MYAELWYRTEAAQQIRGERKDWPKDWLPQRHKGLANLLQLGQPRRTASCGISWMPCATSSHFIFLSTQAYSPYSSQDHPWDRSLINLLHANLRASDSAFPRPWPTVKAVVPTQATEHLILPSGEACFQRDRVPFGGKFLDTESKLGRA